MSESLRSVGLDVGTTTTQLIVSELKVENRASGFAVPEMEITERQILYRGEVQFTPLKEEKLVDGAALRRMVEEEYKKAGLRREDVDTGAVIITGETSRKENARAVLNALSEFSGEFVVATAGPHLESVLAAKGAGAVEYSQQTGKTVLHIDIGGGTSNLALIQEGRILRTGCLNVGGRLLKLDRAGRVTYCSEVLKGLCHIKVGDCPGEAELTELARVLVQALEMAAGLRPEGALLEQLTTRETGEQWRPPEVGAVLSFSGGVADCIEQIHEALAFGDIGPILGREIRKSLLCSGAHRLGTETIRATVIGAGCHSAQLSGSTVFHRGVSLPIKNLPVEVFTGQEQASSQLPELIARRISQKDSGEVVLAMPGYKAASYGQVTALAEAIVQGTAGKSIYVCLEEDMAKALGHALCLRMDSQIPCLCIDRVRLQEESFLDVGEPVGPCLPVVIKTLVLSRG